jgi:hypothetical protein
LTGITKKLGHVFDEQAADRFIGLPQIWHYF